MADSPPTEPCSSKAIVGDNLNFDDDMVLNVKDEEAEIARLELPNSSMPTELEDKPKVEATPEPDDDRIPRIEFNCSACNMKEMVHYFGKSPPFVSGLKLLEDTFVLRDPFQPPPPRWKPKAEYFVALGVNCSECERPFCRDTECSFFYTRAFCLLCAERNVKIFPLEVQAKLRRQLSAKLDK